MTDARTVDGRIPGRRGAATRLRLLECTRQMLEQGSFRELKVVDIARQAGTSPATFYQYFADVEGAIAVLAEAMIADGAERLPGMVRAQDWRPRSAYAASEAVVAGFFSFWEDNRPLMRVIDLTAAEGNVMIRPMRMRLMNEFARSLADVVSQRIAAGGHLPGTDPMAVASVVVTLLVNVAIQRYQFAFYGIDRAAVDESVVRMVYGALIGKRPPKQTAVGGQPAVGEA